MDDRSREAFAGVWIAVCLAAAAVLGINLVYEMAHVPMRSAETWHMAARQQLQMAACPTLVIVAIALFFYGAGEGD